MAVTGKRPTDSFIKAVVKKYHEVTRSPKNADTLGLKACPSCGSESVIPWSDWIGEWDSDGLLSGDEIPGVECKECGYRAHGEDIPAPPSGRGDASQ